MSCLRAIAPCFAAVALLGCTQDFPPPALLKCASLDEFTPVSGVLEKRCGTLDCHGSVHRPLKIYGKRGLRLFLPEEYGDDAVAENNNTVPGGKDTTEAEIQFNWRSACGLEPELMTRVVEGQAEPLELLLIRKPLRVERHKGEQLFIRNDAAYNCLVSWLEGAVITSECDLAVKEL